MRRSVGGWWIESLRALIHLPVLYINLFCLSAVKTKSVSDLALFRICYIITSTLLTFFSHEFEDFKTSW